MRNSILFAVIFGVLLTSGVSYARGRGDMMMDKRMFRYLPEATQTALKDFMDKTKESMKAKMDDKKRGNRDRDMGKEIRDEKDTQKQAQMAKDAILQQIEMEKNMLNEKLKVLEQMQSIISNN